MQQTLHKETVKIDKETEFRHTSDGAGKLFTEVLLYQVTLKPGFYRPASGFGAPFVSRAMLTKIAKLFHGGYPTTSIGFARNCNSSFSMYFGLKTYNASLAMDFGLNALTMAHSQWISASRHQQ